MNLSFPAWEGSAEADGEKGLEEQRARREGPGQATGLPEGGAEGAFPPSSSVEAEPSLLRAWVPRGT